MFMKPTQSIDNSINKSKKCEINYSKSNYKASKINLKLLLNLRKILQCL